MSLDFWGDDEIEVSDGTANMGGGDFEIIPAGTNVLFQIESIEIKEPGDFDSTEYLNIQWSILKPDDYANRRVFQKIRIFDTDSTKRKKARTMLSAIDTNSGGRLSAYGKKKGKSLADFTSEDFTVCLVGQSMMGKLMVWKDNDTKEPKGNWVQQVSPAGNSKPLASAPKAAPEPIKEDDSDDDIPF